MKIVVFTHHMNFSHFMILCTYVYLGNGCALMGKDAAILIFAAR
jgi:hypothetical protein